LAQPRHSVNDFGAQRWNPGITLRQTEAETDLVRIRNLIMNVESTLIELHEFAAEADGDMPKAG
jgi:hypothetical protein